MASGKAVGPFEVLEALGAGGMGEVFKARDTRLNRFVAIKFLPEAASADARERFQREAQAIAALNHPHICTLYEVGEDHGRPYLVLELLEGETLRARLARGGLAPEQVLDWATQIADALDAAHKRGVLHRDLKPDNIWISPGGHIKVLDFGLARLEAAADSRGGEDKTLITSPGIALGTVPYMSPEQAKGEALDARSDLFSFGAVAYEMAGGRAAFPGRSAAEIIAAILKEQPPPLRERRPELPPKLEEVVGRCLEKDPELRYQSAADLRSELKRLSRSGLRLESSGTAASSAALPSPSAPAAAASDSQILSGLLRRHWRWPAVAAAAVVVAAIAAGLWWRLAGPAAAPYAVAPQLQFRQLTSNGNVVDAVISPDGKFLAHVDNGPHGTSLHLLSMGTGGNSSSDVEIAPPGPGCCQSPAFSPDGSQVYFLENRALKAVPLLGGAERVVVDNACSGPGFSPDGKRMAYLITISSVSELMVSQADGSQARQLNRAPAGDGYLSQCWISSLNQPTHGPAWSPDGRWIAVAEGPVSGDGHILLVDTSSGQARPLGPALIPTAADMNWLPDGSGLITTASIPASAAPQLWELHYPDGHLTQLTNDLQGYSAASLAASGQLAVVHAVPQYSIWTQARPGGAFQPLPGGGGDQAGFDGLAWTATGGLVSLRTLGGKQQIWTENGDGSGARALPIENIPDDLYDLNVAPDGTIVFGSNGTIGNVWRVNGDGTGLAPVLHLDAGAAAFGPSLMSGRREIAYLGTAPNGQQGAWAVPLAGGAPHQLWPGYVYAGCCAASPDGTRVFAPARGPRGKTAVVIRVDGGQPPVAFLAAWDPKTMATPTGWTADGRAITFLHRQGTTDNIWALPLAGGPPYAITHFNDLNIAAYANSHDGRLAVSRGSQNSDAVVATGLTGKGGDVR